ncbi:preprotein translocase subunit SecA [Candidatus Peribacteria bacterium RIFCSPLOWO2_12_FULL_53_10]|nr:MAG: preprotein translocase subunit SecA [Candidatus Peribacteria bacterium RIFCSPLOWO2_12_FULL_53_10]
MSFLDRFFKQGYEGELKSARVLVPAINALEEKIKILTDEQLKEKTAYFKGRFEAGEPLDDLLPEAYAVVREAARRTLGQRHFDVQLVGGILLHRGKITEMRTGEGKTLVGTLPAYLNALAGKGVHIVTVNDYLARRDAVWMGQIYAALGMTVGVINHDASYIYDASHTQDTAADAARDAEGSFRVVYDYLRPCARPEAYRADITYGTNNEFGFDYLRDNIEYDIANLRQRAPYFAIVDEVDSVFIDEARTPLIISAPAQDSENLYAVFARIAEQLHADEHFLVDEKLHSATLTDSGIERAQVLLGIDNIYTDRGIKYVHHLETSVKAKALYLKDKEYVVRENEVVIVDEHTGRLQPGRRWSDGLHQAIEAKEGVKIQRESRTYASITFQNYFRMYEKLAGMTGTALTSAEEFYTVYKLEVVPVPTNRETKRIDHNDLIFQTEKGKFEAVIRTVRELHERGQPVLLGTASIERNEALSAELARAGIPHEMLNAKNHEREGEIIAGAGEKGKVTLATNMAGRGVDIKLGGVGATEEMADEVRSIGGLFVLGTERHEARRTDDQLRGRSGRQGDPGETQFFVSMEDTLMRVFASDAVKSMMGRFGIPEDQPIENRMITRSLESAQRKIEGFHFDARKQVLAYDDVLNLQRQAVYARRKELLTGSRDEVDAVRAEVVATEPSLEELLARKRAEFGNEQWYALIRRLTLQVLDLLWVEHLELMNYTRSSVNLRAYGQRDPLIEYRREGNRLFKEMQDALIGRLVELIPNVVPEAVAREEVERKHVQENARLIGGSDTSGDGEQAHSAGGRFAPARAEQKPGRNDLVTVTNGAETKEMKYKKAELLIASGWRLVP